MEYTISWRRETEELRIAWRQEVEELRHDVRKLAKIRAIENDEEPVLLVTENTELRLLSSSAQQAVDVADSGGSGRNG